MLSDVLNDRKRCTLAKSAQRHAPDHIAELLQTDQDLPSSPLPATIRLQNLQHTLRTLTARYAFATGFSLCKAHEETGNLYHTGMLIHDNHSAGSYDCIKFLYGIKIKRFIQMLLRQTSARRSADLYGFKLSIRPSDRRRYHK